MALQFINLNEQESIIEVFGTIGDSWDSERKNTASLASKELARIKALKAKTITVKINSLGGDVNHALAIFDLLEEHEAEIVTQIIGLCASAATVIAAAGTTRKMSRNALFLIHQCSSYVGRANELQLAAELESQKAVNKRILSIYTQKCNSKSSQEVTNLFVANAGQGKWLEASEALRLGFVTDIYNENKKVACINKKSFENSLLPELPEDYADFLTDETGSNSETVPQEAPTESFLDSLKNIFFPKNNKNQPSMKNLFPFLCLAACLTDEHPYSKEKGATFTDEQLAAIEKSLKELSNLKTSLEAMKKETDAAQNAQTAFADMQKQYTDLKAIVDALSGITLKVDGKDPITTTTTQTFADWQKNNKYYQDITKEFS